MAAVTRWVEYSVSATTYPDASNPATYNVGQRAYKEATLSVGDTFTINSSNNKLMLTLMARAHKQSHWLLAQVSTQDLLPKTQQKRYMLLIPMTDTNLHSVNGALIDFGSILEQLEVVLVLPYRVALIPHT